MTDDDDRRTILIGESLRRVLDLKRRGQSRSRMGQLCYYVNLALDRVTSTPETADVTWDFDTSGTGRCSIPLKLATRVEEERCEKTGQSLSSAVRVLLHQGMAIEGARKA